MRYGTYARTLVCKSVALIEARTGPIGWRTQVLSRVVENESEGLSDLESLSCGGISQSLNASAVEALARGGGGCRHVESAWLGLDRIRTGHGFRKWIPLSKELYRY
eukprot:2967328-Rhodomonas_salina.1